MHLSGLAELVYREIGDHQSWLQINYSHTKEECNIPFENFLKYKVINTKNIILKYPETNYLSIKVH